MFAGVTDERPTGEVSHEYMFSGRRRRRIKTTFGRPSDPLFYATRRNARFFSTTAEMTGAAG